MQAPMDATAHRRLGSKRTVLVSVFVGALLAVAALLLWQRYDDDTSLAQPEIVLGSGSFEGRDWVTASTATRTTRAGCASGSRWNEAEADVARTGNRSKRWSSTPVAAAIQKVS